MEQSENRFETSLWPRGNSHATTIPPRILAYTQAPTGPDAEVRWKFDDNLEVYVEFRREADEQNEFSYRTSLNTRKRNSHIATVPEAVLDHYDALTGDDAIVVWTFNLADEHPVRPTFTTSPEPGDDSE